MVEETSILDKYITYGAKSCQDFKNPKHEAVYKRSIADKKAFFDEQAKRVHWFKPYTTVLDDSQNYFSDRPGDLAKNPVKYRWFADGEINISYNCLDRHVEAGHGDRVCFYQDSVYTGVQKAWTYKEVLEQVGRLASVYKNKFGLKSGDRVIIYMPMIIESAFAMLACARIGAVHSVVFGGFAPKELASRIDDSEAKLIVTASMGIEPGKYIPYPPIVEEALTHCKLAHARMIPRLIVQRYELGAKLMFPDIIHNQMYFDYHQCMAEQKECAAATPVLASHPLYILYTSGTTGQPKGIYRDQGGTVVGLNFVQENVFNVHRESVHFATSDIGWVVGHSNIIYGPLIRGASCVFFEGKPVTPHAGIIWEKVQQYKVTSLYMAPTGVRIVKKFDYDGEWVTKFDTSTMDNFALVGERCDPDTIKWIHRHFPKVIINDTWWQTETGWPITGNLTNLSVFDKVYPTLPGSVTRAVPGYEVKIFDDSNKEVAPNELGKVVIKLPMPPSFMLGIWGNDQAFIDKYLADTPGYYTSGDAGVIDENGYLHIMTRLDDVINTCGHRISTGRLEEVINAHDEVVESAVLGYNEKTRGECPLAFVVLKGQGAAGKTEAQLNKIKHGVNEQVRNDVGAFARLIGCIIVEKLPKTRSGKILRGTMRKICNNQEYAFPATIDDATTLDVITKLSTEWKATLKE